MLDVTRNSFDESKGYIQVAFQRNRDVLDAELNELQDVLRVDMYRGRARLERTVLADGTDTGPKVVLGASSYGKGKDFSAKSGTATQLVLSAGDCEIYGYRVASAADITITGLTNPVGARTDYVWVSLQEAWVDSAADTNIAVSKLGETTQRRVLQVTFGVTEGGAPTSTGEPWMGLVKYVVIGKLYRTGSNTAFEAFVDLRQLGGNLARGSSNNLFMSARRLSLSTDGTELAIDHLSIVDPFLGALVEGNGNIIVTVAEGDVIGWSGEGASRLRRAQGGGKITTCTPGASESADTSPLVVQTWKAATSVPNDDTCWLCYITATGAIFRDGTYLHRGDVIVNWRQGGDQISCYQGSDVGVGGHPYLKKYRCESGHVGSVVDYLGLAGAGFVFEFQELFWSYNITDIVSTVVPTPAWSPWTAYIASAGSTSILFGAVDQPTSAGTILGMQLKSTSGAAGTVHLAPNVYFGSGRRLVASQDCLIVGEWTVNFCTDKLPAAGKKSSFSFGFASLFTGPGYDWVFHPSSGLVGGLPSDKSYWVFFCDLEGTWHAASRRSGSGVDVSALAWTPTANRTYRFRIELLGATYSEASPSGGHVRYWIDDGYYAGTPTLASPGGLLGDADPAPVVGPIFAAGCAEAGSGEASVTFGPMKIRWKQVPQT